jgi:hypothetical protein
MEASEVVDHADAPVLSDALAGAIPA